MIDSMENAENEIKVVRQIAKDEEVLAMIIAGGVASGRPISRGEWGEDRPDGPVCAVGAGLLYAGVLAPDGDRDSCIVMPERFAEVHGTSRAYAYGVTDGFEACFGPQGTELAYYYGVNKGDPDYLRGREVGAAAYEALVAGVE